MSLTIYTVSDPATVGSVMTSMAMFFGQDSWVGGAVKLALLISLLFILGKGVLSGGGLRLDSILLQLIVVMVAFIPTTTVTIEQFDNNAPPRVVDDVPYGIALPGAIAGSFALFMTQKIETVMQGVDGKYITASGEVDPFAPARMLMQIAAMPSDPGRFMDPNLVQTLHLASRYCGTGEMSNIKFDQSRDGFKAFASGMVRDGTWTIKYDKDHPYKDGGASGVSTTCAEVASYIENIGTSLASGGQEMFDRALQGIAETTDTKRYQEMQDGTPTSKTWEDTLADLNRVAPFFANLNNLAVANVMSYTVLKQTARESKSAIGDMVEMQRDTGLFAWAKDEAMQSMMVQTTAPKFMDILFFIFIAATPIVMFVVAANPVSGVKVAGAYVLFGLWTQSWIPMMAIINGWYQAEIRSFASPGSMGLTPEYLSALMKHVSTATIAASNMLQSAPYMMFAIMTGSMFALSNVVSKAAPSGGAAAAGGVGDQSSAGGAGGGGKTSPFGGAVVGNAGSQAAMLSSLGQARAAMTGGYSGVGGTKPMGDANVAAPGSPDWSTGSTTATSAAANHERAAQLQDAVAKQRTQAVNDVAAVLQAGGFTKSGAQTSQLLNQAGFQNSWDAGTQTMTMDGKTFSFGAGQSQSTATKLSAALVAKARADFNSGKSLLGGLLEKGSGVSFSGGVGIQGQAGTETGRAQNANVAVGTEQANIKQGTVGQNANHTNGQSAATGFTGSDGATWNRMGQLSKQAQDSLQSLVKQTQMLSEANKLTQSAQSGAKADSGTTLKSGDIANQWGLRHNSQSAGEADKRVEAALGGAIGGAALSKFQQLAAQERSRLEADHAGISLSQDQIAAMAALRALDKMGQGGSLQQKNEAALGAATLAKEAGMHDSTGHIKANMAASKLLDQVEANIAQTEGQVKPKTAAATGEVDKGLAGANAIRDEATGLVGDGKHQAEGLHGAATAGAAEVKAQGADAVAKQQEQVAAQANANANPDRALAGFNNAADNQSTFLPTRGDAPRMLESPDQTQARQQAEAARAEATVTPLQHSQGSTEVGYKRDNPPSASAAPAGGGAMNPVAAMGQIVAATGISSDSTMGTVVNMGIDKIGGMTGGGGGGGAPATAQPAQPSSSKPNASAPSAGPEGKAPTPGRK